MSKNKSLLITNVALILLGITLADPFKMGMNNMTLILVCGLLLASFAAFAGLLWNEKAEDERESQILDRGGRFSYLMGMSVLILALVIQSFEHAVDNWLVVAIVVMIVSKQLYVIRHK